MLRYFTFIISENDEIYERKECIITQHAKKHYTTVNKPAIEILTVRLISWLPDLNNSILYKSYTQVKWQILFYWVFRLLHKSEYIVLHVVMRNRKNHWKMFDLYPPKQEYWISFPKETTVALVWVL